MLNPFAKKMSLVLLIGFFANTFTYAQNHSSVNIENRVYYILEQAQIRGIIAPMSGVRPYPRNVVTRAIQEILNSNTGRGITDTERAVLRDYLEHFSPSVVLTGKTEWSRGVHHSETEIGSHGVPLTLNVGTNFYTEGSAALQQFSPETRRHWSAEAWLRFYFNGDIGSWFSWEFSGEGGAMRVPREFLGYYNTYYDGFGDHEGYQNRIIEIYSEPLTHFPFSYKPRWDSSVHPIRDPGSFLGWPTALSGSYNLESEVAASFMENKLFFRFGRISREWGSNPFGSSLTLHNQARPFLAMEYEFSPVSWFTISSMTGGLEFANIHGEKDSGMIFQNLYSISLMQFRYKNYFFLDLGEAVIWPKRFELGYMSPITNTIFYKNNIGDFDNLSAHISVRGQYPKLGTMWASLFWDEVWWRSDFWKLDRSMYAWQVGSVISLPFLSFSSLKVSYTKNNPYNYTHVRNTTPWHSDPAMEQAYINHGQNLGYYLPPNSDEFLVRIETLPLRNLMTHVQFQRIRRGANYGSSAVDGSHIYSELDPDNRNTNPISKRYFLRDGAYQWFYIVKAGGELSLSRLPVTFFGEAGFSYSIFTNIDERANITGEPHSYKFINTFEYPSSLSIIARFGVKIFAR